MYYKLTVNGKIVDTLKNPSYVKWQQKNNILLDCEKDEADGVLSSNQLRAYQIVSGNKDRFAGVVEMVEITESEYEELSKTYPDSTNVYGVTDEVYHAIIDDYTAEMFGGEADA